MTERERDGSSAAAARRSSGEEQQLQRVWRPRTAARGDAKAPTARRAIARRPSGADGGSPCGASNERSTRREVADEWRRLRHGGAYRSAGCDGGPARRKGAHRSRRAMVGQAVRSSGSQAWSPSRSSDADEEERQRRWRRQRRDNDAVIDVEQRRGGALPDRSIPDETTIVNNEA
ncbi:hypothetical protein Scep_024372 [Stephania cephalantha]|uniref:Uncharacterized protein n=1 Tax=Stephania cephalantha TaxID=152367 RepID=A0AAP0EZA1_9MAGN